MSQFFENFPITYYRFSNTEEPILLTHILRRFKFKEYVKSLVSVWDAYLIRDGMSPDAVAYEIYNDPYLHWLILLFNDIVDPFTDWPMDQDVLTKYISKKYSDINGIHHYQKNNRIVPSNVEGAEPVTNLEFEILVNDAKRKIRIPKIEHLKPIMDELEKVLKEKH